MLRSKIAELGKLTFLDDGGLVCSITSDRPPSLEESTLKAALYGASPIELAIGDLVAHSERHGVARYRYIGRKRINNEKGESGDHLVLENAHGARLYVPLGQGHLVQKLGANGVLQSYCVEALPNAYGWPGIGTFPELPQESTPERRAEWRRACATYRKALHANASYRQAAHEYFERQSREPQPFLDWWVYRGMVLQVGPIESAHIRNPDEQLLLIKQYVLRRERRVERIQREVESLENSKSLGESVREPIPENVRFFVWRRDKGQCVRCGSRERLEFDHIIPVVAGGSNTERNIQLLCESCNRSKGAII